MQLLLLIYSNNNLSCSSISFSSSSTTADVSANISGISHSFWSNFKSQSLVSVWSQFWICEPFLLINLPFLIQQLLFFDFKHASFLPNCGHSAYIFCYFRFITLMTFHHNLIHYLTALSLPASFYSSTMMTGHSLLFKGSTALQETFTFLSR